MTAARETFTIAEVASRYATTAHSVLGWVHAGTLRAINIAQRLDGKRPRWRITPAALDEFERSRTASPAPKIVRRTRRRRDEGLKIKQFFR